MTIITKRLDTLRHTSTLIIMLSFEENLITSLDDQIAVTMTIITKRLDTLRHTSTLIITLSFEENLISSSNGLVKWLSP